MLRFFFLGRVLRASVAPKGFALDSSPGDDFLPAADPMEGSDGGIRWREMQEYYRYYSPALRLPSGDDLGR